MRSCGTLAFCPSVAFYSTWRGCDTAFTGVTDSPIYQSKRTATVVYIAPVDFPGCTKVIFQTSPTTDPDLCFPSCPIRDAPADHSCRTRGTGQATAPLRHLPGPRFCEL